MVRALWLISPHSSSFFLPSFLFPLLYSLLPVLFQKDAKQLPRTLGLNTTNSFQDDMNPHEHAFRVVI